MTSHEVEIRCKIDEEVYQKIDYHIYNKLSNRQKISIMNNPTMVINFEAQRLICEKVQQQIEK